MIFSRLENIELEKRTSLRVGSSDFISLDPLKTFFPSSGVSDVLMIKNPDKSSYSLSSDVLTDSSEGLIDMNNVLSNSSDEINYLNKGITGITYNFFNLPEVIMMGTGKTIMYTYNAAGQN